MPNFDGSGPLKRGRIIGRGRGPCQYCTEGRTRNAEDRDAPVRSGTP
jgi:hypothetical protein